MMDPSDKVICLIYLDIGSDNGMRSDVTLEVLAEGEALLAAAGLGLGPPQAAAPAAPTKDPQPLFVRPVSQRLQSEEMGPDPGRFELSKGILKCA